MYMEVDTERVASGMVSADVIMSVDETPLAAAIPRSLLAYRRNKLLSALPLFVDPPSLSEIPMIELPTETPTPVIDTFLTRWPPSRTPESYTQWIALKYGTFTLSDPNVDAMRSSWNLILREGSVSVEAVDDLALAHNARSGKWLIFTDDEEVDTLFASIVRLVVRRGSGLAKVSPKKDSQPNHYVICIYIEDATNYTEVLRLREDLREIGIHWKIGFKLDAYTLLGIYKNNIWGIHANRYWE